MRGVTRTRQGPIEVRASDLGVGDTFAEFGMDPVTAAEVASHGDTVLVTDTDGGRSALDTDDVVELLHRPGPR